MTNPSPNDNGTSSSPPPSKKQKMTKSESKLPVTLLTGFLGAGKSTLLKNILETKDALSDDTFKCAVIVNDMAELNIDKSLMESTGLIQSDEIISMQNGCVCCSLSGDMVTQIRELTSSGTKFDYIIIEASGVSEPAAIAALFEECEDDHDHSQHQSLHDVAKMDTIVTVVDSGAFLENLNYENKKPETNMVDENIPKLLFEQLEYANVVLLNKVDLVDSNQLDLIQEKIKTIVPRATIIPCENSTIDVSKVVNTGSFNPKNFQLENFIGQFDSSEDKKKGCCQTAEAKGESPCCLRARTLDSGLSQVLLPSKTNKKTRHGENYNIGSFVYKARRPFSSAKMNEEFLMKYFILSEDDDDDNDDEHYEDMETEGNGEDKPMTEEEIQKKEQKIKRRQEEGEGKKALRTENLGSILRMKGYMWQASFHDIIHYFSIAGNIATVESPGVWNVLKREAYIHGNDEKKALLRKGWVAPYGDRRQEIVFIGQDLKHEKIQKTLDSCLLTDEQMAMGVDAWKAVMGDMFLDA